MRDSELNKNLKGYSLDSTDILAPGKTNVAVLYAYISVGTEVYFIYL